jgi:hypothetical protein
MPREAQPVPPIFQPEVAARAIFWAAHHRRREVNVGLSTIKAILGSKIIPGLLDRYLARIGYDAQQAELPRRVHSASNLWHPLPGDYGAHGRFDWRAKGLSLQLWLTTHRGLAAAVTACLVGAAFFTHRRLESIRVSNNRRKVEQGTKRVA